MRAVAETAVEVAGLAAIAAGVFVLAGLGWALVAGGLEVVAVMIWRSKR